MLAANRCAARQRESGCHEANRLRRKEFDLPLSRFPLRGQAGAGGFPPRRKHAARQPKALARIDAAGSPHKRAAAPLCIPRAYPGIYRTLSGVDMKARSFVL